MEVEGMVHALEEIQRLLKPDGCLIDIHPIREAPLIRVYQGRNLLFAESDPGYDYDADIRHAEEALENSAAHHHLALKLWKAADVSRPRFESVARRCQTPTRQGTV